MNNIYLIFWVLIQILGSGLAIDLSSPESYYHNPYSYSYSVKDEYTGNNFGAQEQKNQDNSVIGSYQVHLPDGRLQRVDYTADGYNGYIANVNYEGVQVHPGPVHPGPVHPGPVHPGQFVKPVSYKRELSSKPDPSDFVIYDPKLFY